jgi:hypothetical protein
MRVTLLRAFTLFVRQKIPTANLLFQLGITTLTEEERRIIVEFFIPCFANCGNEDILYAPNGLVRYEKAI